MQTAGSGVLRGAARLGHSSVTEGGVVTLVRGESVQALIRLCWVVLCWKSPPPSASVAGGGSTGAGAGAVLLRFCDAARWRGRAHFYLSVISVRWLAEKCGPVYERLEEASSLAFSNAFHSTDLLALLAALRAALPAAASVV